MADRDGLYDEPALVERPARDRQDLALEVSELLQRSVLLHHDRADRGRIRIELQPGAKRPLTRHPQPVHHRDIHRTGVERQLAGIGRRHFGKLEIEIGGGSQPMPFDDIELPRERSGLLQADTQRIRGEGRRRDKDQNDDDDDTEHQT